MSNRSFTGLFTLKIGIIAAALILVSLGGCHNDLITSIEEEVALAITPPSIINIYPLPNAENVAVTANTITIEFSKAIDSSSVTSSTITIRDGEDRQVSGSFSVSGQTVSFSPSGALTYSVNYTVRITSGVKDTDGNPLVDSFEWSFTTTFDPNADRTPPTITNFLINGGASATNSTSVSIFLLASDEGGSGPQSYKLRHTEEEWPESWSDLTENAVFISESTLPDGVDAGSSVQYEALVMDGDGNISSAETASIMYDLTPPSIISRSPAENQTAVPYNASVVSVIFSDEMDPASFNGENFYIEKDGTPILTEFDYEFSSYNDTPLAQASIVNLNLEPNTDYVVTVKSSIREIAGNQFGLDHTWFFQTGAASDQTAPTATVSISGYSTLPNGTIPYDGGIGNPVDLTFHIEDDYNGIKGLKIWGDGTLPTFEESASWIPYEEKSTSMIATVSVNLDDSDRTYNILYRLQDSMGNISPSPVPVKVLLDTAAPTIHSVQTVSGITHIADLTGEVSLLISAEDVDTFGDDPGVGISRITFSNESFPVGFPADPSLVSEDDWEAWAPIREGWIIDTGTGDPEDNNGPKTVYIGIQDYLGNAAATVLDLTWDTVSPEISFSTAQELEVNAPAVQTGTFLDNIAVHSYLWEKEEGPGEVTFSDATITSPTVSADTDGTYILKLTIADQAGNTAISSVPFKWDTTDPDSMTSINTSGYYSTIKRPNISWASVSGANIYQVLVKQGGSTLAGPNTVSLTTYTPAFDLPEGEVTFEVTPFDNAGNFSNTGTATIFVDTVNPVISNDGQLFLRNIAAVIDYDNGPDGTVTENGSGIDTILWEQTSGTGTLDFNGGATILNPLVSASSHGYYGLGLTVQDAAGNSSYATFTFNWDIIGPDAPTVTGINRTPNTAPTWFWNTGGNGGFGEYRFRMERADGQPVDIDPTAGTDIRYLDYSTPITDTFFSPSMDGIELPADGIADSDDEGGEFSYILYVQERDQAGNWSAAGTKSIWVDGTFTAPPEVVIEGASLRNTTTVTWNWSSGADQTPGATTYRYKIDDGEWLPDSDGDLIETTGILDFGTSGLDLITFGEDKSFTIYVNEYNEKLSPSAFEGPEKYGEHTVQIDLKGPAAPSVTNFTATPTNDSTPTWGWSSTAGTDGTGEFQYLLDSLDWGTAVTTTATVFTPSSSLTHGDHILRVRERDSLGNWGDYNSRTITVDTQAPTLNSISLNSGSSYTNSSTVTATISATYEPGMTMSFYDYNPSGWKDWEAYSPTKTITLPSGEGSKRVYVRLQDSLGNVSSYQYDDIIVDQTSPTNGSLQLNGGDTYTPSLGVVLNMSVSDNYSGQSDMEFRYYYNGVWSNYLSFNTAYTVYDLFTYGTGSKGVYVQFKDGAGNTSSSYYDSIYLQAAQPNYAYKGYYSSGAVNVYFNPVSEPAGSNSNRYYIYSSTEPDLVPNEDSSGLEYEGSTSSTSYATVYIPKGELRYFWVRAYNVDTGGYGPYSTANVLGFSSNITIIYDDDDSADIARAQTIKAIAEDTTYSGGIANFSTVVGTVPSWTVTMLPEDLVSNVYSTNDIIYGDPIITTPGTYFTTSTSYDGRVRNIAASNKGIISMGSSGANFLYRVDQMWSTWGLFGTQPSAIDSGNHMILTATKTAMTRPYTTSENIWNTPLYHTALYPSQQNNSYEVGVFSAATGRRGVYISTQSNPSDGAIYAGDINFASHFPVVRQGRFCYWGFYEPPSSSYVYGNVFFVNLLARMDNF